MRRLLDTLWLCVLAIFLCSAHAAELGNASPLQFRNIRKEYDAANNRVWFIPESAPKVVNAPAFYLYFGKGERDMLTALRLKVIYSGKQLLDVRRYWATADGKQLTSFPVGQWQTEQFTQVWEWLDAPIDNARQVHDLLTLAGARQGVLYFSGQSGKLKIALSPHQKRAIRDVIAAYQASGGNLSW